MIRAVAASVVLLFGAPALYATSVHSIGRDDIVENPKYCSPNGRFCVVAREFINVPDFGRVRAEEILDFGDADYVSPMYSADQVVAFYDGRRLVGSAKLDGYPRFIGVADSGRSAIIDRSLFRIFAADGSVIRDLPASDVFTPSDAAALHDWNFWSGTFIRGDDLVIAVPASRRTRATEEVRIRLADGSVTRPPHDISPQPRVWATVADPPRRRWTIEPPCFADLVSHAARISPKQLFARAIDRPLPPYPVLARKARIAGNAWAEVIVSASGAVVCSRIGGLPFGIGEAVEQAVRRWTFEPYIENGTPMPMPMLMTSEIEFHFDVLGGAEWNDVLVRSSEE